MDQAKIQKLDSAIFQSAKQFQVLKHLAWPAGEDENFLRNWNRGNKSLPIYRPIIPELNSQIHELEELMKQCNQNHPIEKYLHETAESYALSGHMLQATGTKEFTRYSTMIYGRPDDQYKNQNMTALDSAKYFLDVTDNLIGGAFIPQTESNISSQDFAAWMKSGVDDFFHDDPVEVVLDDKISAKALAGSKAIKICNSTLFSQLDKKQLLNHEAFIHSATMINGKKQDHLMCMALGAPRTTRTQEGLAVFAELATMSMDITRLRRIALRIPAIQMALEGADFIEIFKFFLANGQSEIESVRSSQRVFRGGDVKGGVVFTKDGVYLQGLLEVHAFMKIAITENNPDYIQNLFAGRITMGDVVRLAPYFENGWIKPPTYVPEWASDFRKLAALLAYSSFVSRINLEKIKFERFIEFEEELKVRQ